MSGEGYLLLLIWSIVSASTVPDGWGFFAFTVTYFLGIISAKRNER